jgi:hypothetical protein
MPHVAVHDALSLTLIISTCTVLQAASPLKADYQLLVYALLGGDNRALEVLFKAHPHLLPTLEDYVWAKLMVVEAGASGAGTGPLPGPSTPGGSGLSSSSSYVRRGWS